MKRWLANWRGHAVYLAPTIVILAMGWMLYATTTGMHETGKRVDHTLEVVNGLSNITQAVARAESAQRGYLLYGDERFVAERDRALAEAGQELAHVRARIADNPAQAARAVELERLLSQRKALMGESETTRRETGAAPSRPVSTGRGTRITAQIYAATDRMETEARSQLESRRAADEAQYRKILWALLAAGVGSLVVILPAYAAFMRESRRRFRAERRAQDLAESLPGAVFQYRRWPDGRGKYEFLSGGTRELRGVDIDKALADPEVIIGTMIDGDRQAALAHLAECEAQMKPMQYDYRVIDGQGRIRWIQVSQAPRRERNGSVLWTGHWEDVSVRKAMEKELHQAKEAADAASRAKSTFLATMSHEIRTPMNGVLGSLELLAFSRLDAEQRGTVEVIRESARSLLRIIDDILDFSKIEAGKLDLRPSSVSIADVVERVHNMYAGNASSKGLLLTRTVDRRISKALTVDPLRLQQVLNNLVSNAIKFTVAGEVSIEAVLLDRVDDEEAIRFTVSDTGIGISEESQKQLFTPFTQATQDTARLFGGTGLGLSICQRLASLMGGAIEMRSRPGSGTTVTLTLRLPIAALPPAAAARAPAAEPIPARRAPTTAEAEREGSLLLLVDDHPINRMVLQKQANILGYAAETAKDGVEALDMWSAGRFAAVITDCNMPEMTGYELARHIRECEKRHGHKHTPIIACTANALGGEAEKCLAAGMDAYLAKPIELPQLAQRLAQFAPLPPLPQDGPVVIDRGALEDLAAGDREMEDQIILRFVEHNNGDARALEAAVANADLARTASAAHRIKGAALTVGAKALAAICADLERAGKGGDQPACHELMGKFREELNRLEEYASSLQT